MNASKRILICPLDWGLGHASRCIPLIRYLVERKHEVLIAALGGPEALLREEFPNLKIIPLHGYNIRYSAKFLWLKLLTQVPKICVGIYREHQALKRICKAEKIDVVISDNRFGCWNSACSSIFITHQIFILAPVFQSLIRRLNFWCMKQYQQVWIPDVKRSPGFSGILSHGKNIPAHASYIGLLSRFTADEKNSSTENSYKICVLLSGPEPQRTLLETLVLAQLKALQLKSLVVRGLPNSNQKLPSTSLIQIENHLSSALLQKHIAASELVVCRSGYSSIMDLAALGKKAVFIPTPAQTEQEYLAALFLSEKICFSANQNSIDLGHAIAQSQYYKGFEVVNSKLDLSEFGF